MLKRNSSPSSLTVPVVPISSSYLIDDKDEENKEHNIFTSPSVSLPSSSSSVSENTTKGSKNYPALSTSLPALPLLSVTQQIYAKFEPLLQKFHSTVLNRTEQEQFMDIITNVLQHCTQPLTPEQCTVLTKLTTLPLVNPLIPSIGGSLRSKAISTASSNKEISPQHSSSSSSSASLLSPSVTERMIHQRLDASSIPMIRYIYSPPSSSSSSSKDNDNNNQAKDTDNNNDNPLTLRIPQQIYANAEWCDTFGYPLPAIQIMGTTGRLPHFVSPMDKELYGYCRKVALTNHRYGQLQLARFISSSGQLFSAYEMSQFEYVSSPLSVDSNDSSIPYLYSVTLSYLHVNNLVMPEKTKTVIQRNNFIAVQENKSIGVTRSQAGGVTKEELQNPFMANLFRLPPAKKKKDMEDDMDDDEGKDNDDYKMSSFSNPDQCSLAGPLSIPLSLKSVLPSSALSSLRSFSWLPSLSLIDNYPNGSVGSTNSPRLLPSSGSGGIMETNGNENYLFDSSNDNGIPTEFTTTGTIPKDLYPEQTKPTASLVNNIDQERFEARLAQSQRLTFFPHSLLLNDPSTVDDNLSHLRNSTVNANTFEDEQNHQPLSSQNRMNDNVLVSLSSSSTETTSRDGFDLIHFDDPSASYLSSLNSFAADRPQPNTLLDV